ncbi:hypothetical protein HK100_010458 [Physocladia obscura]|uniref:Homeobox domain-containing protein n=1 Tax=Physocladia obscura TaxID=109957 RepID=A0AAD5T2B3_9FUNG|nr:hypothetical protein HK100_010458 [Physocladia obscura]
MHSESKRSEADRIFDEIDAFLSESHSSLESGVLFPAALISIPGPIQMYSGNSWPTTHEQTANFLFATNSPAECIFTDIIISHDSNLINGFPDLKFNLPPPSFLKFPASFNSDPFNSPFGASTYCVPTHLSHAQRCLGRLSAPRLKFSVPKMLTTLPPSLPTPAVNFCCSSNTSTILGMENHSNSNNFGCFSRNHPILSHFSPQPQTPSSPSQSLKSVFSDQPVNRICVRPEVLHFSSAEDTNSPHFSERFQLSRECTAYLKARFVENQKPHGSQIRKFSNRLGIDSKKVQKWFQNRRQRVLKATSKSSPTFNLTKK